MFNDDKFTLNPRVYFTRDFIIKHQHISLTQLLLSRSAKMDLGVHSFYPWSSHSIVRELMLNAGTCSLTFSFGHRLEIAHMNKIASLALRASKRLHVHIGTMKMTPWERKRKPKLKVRNLLRTPIVLLNKVS